MAMTRRTYGPAVQREDPPVPLDPKSLVKDQILHWTQQGPNGIRAHAYAIVRDVTKQDVEVALVLPTEPGTKCYDEGGADPKVDKDNVLLRYSSELFPELNKYGVRGCYAIADNENPARIPLYNLAAFRMDDQGGVLIDERDSRELDDHLWRDELQKQKRPTLLGAIATDAEAKQEAKPAQKPIWATRPLPSMPSGVAAEHDFELEI